MKLKMMAADSEESLDYTFEDLFINESDILGFFIPKDQVEEEVVNIIYPEMGVITVISTPKLKEVLIDMFVDV